MYIGSKYFDYVRLEFLFIAPVSGTTNTSFNSASGKAVFGKKMKIEMPKEYSEQLRIISTYIAEIISEICSLHPHMIS